MREVSPTALQAMLAENTSEVFLPCLSITHPDLASPIRIVYDSQPLVRSSGTYLPYAFQVNLPPQTDDEVPQINVTIDNVDLSVNGAIRSLQGPPSVTFDVVLKSSPDTVEAGPFNMSLQTAQANADTIQGTLGYEMGFWDQQVPGQQYLPGTSPGLFM